MREDRQQRTLGGIEARVGMQGAVQAVITGGVFRQFRKLCETAWNEIMQRAVMKLVGVIPVIVVLEHHLPVPGILSAWRRRRSIGLGQPITFDGGGYCRQSRGE